MLLPSLLLILLLPAVLAQLGGSGFFPTPLLAPFVGLNMSLIRSPIPPGAMLPRAVWHRTILQSRVYSGPYFCPPDNNTDCETSGPHIECPAPVYCLRYVLFSGPGAPLFLSGEFIEDRLSGPVVSGPEPIRERCEDDGDPCTFEECDPVFGCVHTLIEGCCALAHPCDPGSVCICNECLDQCDAYHMTCDDDDPCTQNVCTGGVCSNPLINCDDSNPATIDFCDGGVCIHYYVPLYCDGDTTLCEDRACTTVDCIAGTCTYTPVYNCCTSDIDCFVHLSATNSTPNTCTTGSCFQTCAGGCHTECRYDMVQCLPGQDGRDYCSTEQCVPELGVCVSIEDPCDDHNECTVDYCAPVCSESCCRHNTTARNGLSCEGHSGTCQDGVCVPLCQDVTCPTYQCIDSFCDSTTGLCTFVSADDCTACVNDPDDPALVCRQQGRCECGQCIPGPLVDCNDDNPCTKDLLNLNAENPGECCLHVLYQCPADAPSGPFFPGSGPLPSGPSGPSGPSSAGCCCAPCGYPQFPSGPSGPSFYSGPPYGPSGEFPETSGPFFGYPTCALWIPLGTRARSIADGPSNFTCETAPNECHHEECNMRGECVPVFNEGQDGCCLETADCYVDAPPPCQGWQCIDTICTLFALPDGDACVDPDWICTTEGVCWNGLCTETDFVPVPECCDADHVCMNDPGDNPPCIAQYCDPETHECVEVYYNDRIDCCTCDADCVTDEQPPFLISPFLSAPLAHRFAVLAGVVENGDPAYVVGDISYAYEPSVDLSIMGFGTLYHSGPEYDQGISEVDTVVSELLAASCTFTFASVVGSVDLSTDITHGQLGIYTPGVYCVPDSVDVTSDIYFDGDGVYVFRIQGLTAILPGSHMRLRNGASPKNIIWITETNDFYIGGDAEAPCTAVGQFFAYDDNYVQFNAGSVTYGGGFVLPWGSAAFDQSPWVLQIPCTGLMHKARTYAILAEYAAFTNSAPTYVTGDVGFGTQSGPMPTIVDYGTIHDNNAAYSAAYADLGNTVDVLLNLPCTFSFAPSGPYVYLDSDTSHGPVGVYESGIYCIPFGAIISGPLTLDGGGMFVFRMESGPFLAQPSGDILTTRGTEPQDVFWITRGGTITLTAQTVFGQFITTSDGSPVLVGSGSTVHGGAFGYGGAHVYSEGGTFIQPLSHCLTSAVDPQCLRRACNTDSHTCHAVETPLAGCLLAEDDPTCMLYGQCSSAGTCEPNPWIYNDTVRPGCCQINAQISGPTSGPSGPLNHIVWTHTNATVCTLADVQDPPFNPLDPFMMRCFAAFCDPETHSCFAEYTGDECGCCEVDADCGCEPCAACHTRVCNTERNRCENAVKPDGELCLPRADNWNSQCYEFGVCTSGFCVPFGPNACEDFNDCTCDTCEHEFFPDASDVFNSGEFFSGPPGAFNRVKCTHTPYRDGESCQTANFAPDACLRVGRCTDGVCVADELDIFVGSGPAYGVPGECKDITCVYGIASLSFNQSLDATDCECDPDAELPCGLPVYPECQRLECTCLTCWNESSPTIEGDTYRCQVVPINFGDPCDAARYTEDQCLSFGRCSVDGACVPQDPPALVADTYSPFDSDQCERHFCSPFTGDTNDPLYSDTCCDLGRECWVDNHCGYDYPSGPSGPSGPFRCQLGTPRVCPASIEDPTGRCLVPTCFEGGGGCGWTPMAEGTPCDPPDVDPPDAGCFFCQANFSCINECNPAWVPTTISTSTVAASTSLAAFTTGVATSFVAGGGSVTLGSTATASSATTTADAALVTSVVASLTVSASVEASSTTDSSTAGADYTTVGASLSASATAIGGISTASTVHTSTVTAATLDSTFTSLVATGAAEGATTLGTVTVAESTTVAATTTAGARRRDPSLHTRTSASSWVPGLVLGIVAVLVVLVVIVMVCWHSNEVNARKGGRKRHHQ